MTQPTETPHSGAPQPPPSAPDASPADPGTSAARADASSPDPQPAPEEQDLRCTLCGLRACWTG